MIAKRHPLISALLFSVFLSSCYQSKELTYLRHSGQPTAEHYYHAEQPVYRLRVQDILYIKVYSLNREISDLINQTATNYQQGLFQNEASIFVHGYHVNDSGYVELPIMGLIKVINQTVDEATHLIREQVEKYIKDATVTVKLLSFKFTILGEVFRPGTYKNYNHQLTIFEAISMAGDITDVGNRRRVLVLRPEKEGTRTIRLNLTSKAILTSSGFYLMPNDIVYVQPLRSKVFRLNVPAITLAFSTITTFILVLNYLNPSYRK